MSLWRLGSRRKKPREKNQQRNANSSETLRSVEVHGGGTQVLPKEASHDSAHTVTATTSEQM